MSGETMVESYKNIKTENSSECTSPGSVHCMQQNNINHEKVTTPGPILKMISSKSNPFLRCIEKNRQLAATMNMKKDVPDQPELSQTNRISRLRKPKRAQDYYYSDDESKNKNAENTTEPEQNIVTNIKTEIQDKYFNMEEKIDHPLNKRRKFDENNSSDNSINEDSQTQAKCTEENHQREILLPREDEITNDLHYSCNRCLVILQRRIIDTERILQQQLTFNKQLKIDLANEKKARKEDSMLLAQSFTSFGRHYDRLERNLSRVLINNGVQPSVTNSM